MQFSGPEAAQQCSSLTVTGEVQTLSAFEDKLTLKKGVFGSQDWENTECQLPKNNSTNVIMLNLKQLAVYIRLKSILIL